MLAIIIASCKADKTKKELSKEDKTKKELSKEDKKTFIINGLLKNIDTTTLILGYNRSEGYAYDTISVEGGKFTIEGAVGYPQPAEIDFAHDYWGNGNFFLENKTIEIEMDTSLLEGLSVKNSSLLQKEFADYFYKTDLQFRDTLVSLFPAEAIAKTEAEKNSINKKINAILKKQDSLTFLHIMEHPNSFVSADALMGKLSYNPDAFKLDSLYRSMGNTIKSSPLGKQIEEKLAVAKKSSIGAPAIDLKITDTNGNLKTLSDLKGQYVFIDFWASWCYPCRKENPYVKKAYLKFRDKGFEVYAVSLDVDKASWLKAIKDDELPWIHVSDLKKNNKAAELYGISSIPMNFLLDKDGTIIAKGLRGEELLNKMEELF